MNKGDNLEKGLGKILSTAALAGTMALGNVGVNKPFESLPPKNPKPTFSATQLKEEPSFDKAALQEAMARVESNNGRNTNHELLTAGPDAGTKAKGHYGFTNSTIRSVINSSPSLKSTHKHVLDFDDDQMHQLIYNEQPHLQHHLASQQIDNITRALKTKKPEHVAYAWLNGITGASKAIQEGKDIKNHWHVSKVMDAYNDIINKKGQLNKKEKTPPGLYGKFDTEKSKEVSYDIQKIISEQWKKARENLNDDIISEPTKPDPLINWNTDLEELKNSDSGTLLINLLKSKIV